MTDESIFAAALGCPSPEERAKFLAAACDTPEQRARLETLLAAHDHAGSFLDRPAVVVDSDSNATHSTASVGGVTRTADPLSGDPPEDDNAVAFLAPPGRPDSLGRIGHYEVLEVLGRGGFGVVFRAFDDVLQRVVAVKVLAPHLAVTSPARKRFLREARSAALIQHEHVVRIHETGETPLPYLVMEFVPGETLQQRMDRTGPLDVAEAVKVARQIAAGLAAAHDKGLIHRDIKPSNVLIDAGPQQAKITDFGLARAADDASLTHSGVVAGTPMFMAPEQARGEPLDQRADLFSLGSVLYAMLTGRPPFRAANTPAVLKRVAEDDPRPIREVIPEVPEWVCRIVGKLHAKNPAERFQTAKEVADLLADCEKQLTEQKELTDYSRIPGGKPAKPPWRWKGAAGIAAFLAFAGVALAITELTNLTHLFRTPRSGSSHTAVVSWGKVVDPLGDCRFTEENGRLSITVPGNQLHDLNPRPGCNMNSPQVLRAVEGDFEARVTVPPYPWHQGAESTSPYGNYLGAGLVIWSGEDRVARLFRSRSAPFGQGVPQAHAQWDDGQAIGGNKSAVVPDQPLQLRVRRGGRTLQLAYSSDGREWADLATVSDLHLEHQLRVGVAVVNAVKEDFTVHFDGFQVTPLAPPADGFTPLFNGKDLTGWKTHPTAPGDWKVEDGAIVGYGNGKRNTSFLFSEAEYADFHLRVEAKIDALGDAGVWFRAPFDVRIAASTKEPVVVGHLAQMSVRSSWPAHTGSLLTNWPEYAHAPHGLHRADEWFVLEVIARGNHFQTRVNGKPAAEYRDDRQRLTRGRLALQVWGENSSVARFRKVEIQKLPASPQEVPKSAADVLPFLAGAWKVEKRDFDPALPPEQALTVSEAAFDLSTGGNLLALRTRDASFYYSFDPAGGGVRLWHLNAGGLAVGPVRGEFNPEKRSVVWRTPLDGDREFIHEIDFPDANTMTARVFRRDLKADAVHKVSYAYTRATGPVPPVTPFTDAKRPVEMKVLDTLAGEWKTEITLKSAVETWRTTARLTLGGRFLEMTGTKDGSVASDYAVLWYDPAAKTYRQWYFNSDGHTFPMTGTWDAAANALSWETADKTKTGRWTFKENVREFRHAITDGKGKVLSEATGESRRVAAGKK